MSFKFLVTGAGGKFGQRVLHHLLDTLGIPAARVVAATRRPDALAAWAARGVAMAAVDLDDPATLRAALPGVGRMLLISTDAIGRRVVQHRDAVAAAAEAGVRHLVYTSMPEPEGSPALIAPDHAATEAALAESGLPGWTVLRNHWYFENLLGSLPQALASGRWVTAAGSGRIAHIARDDLALGAATALAGEFAGKRVLTLSGAEAQSMAEIAAIAGRVLGKPVAVVPVSPEAYAEGLQAAGLPAPVVRILASLEANIASGRLATVTSDFAGLTGRAPVRFEAWLTANRQAFLPDVAA